jgi:hypothetical protein
MADFDTERWLPDRTPVQPKRGPKVTLPTFSNVVPKPASTISRANGQYDAVRRQLASTGLNDAALGAIEAADRIIDDTSLLWRRGH